MPDNGGEGDPLPGDFPDVPLPPFPVIDCGGADASVVPLVSPPAFASLPCPMRAGEETPSVAPPAAGAGERRPSATFVFPNRKLEDVPGIAVHSHLSGKNGLESLSKMKEK